MSHLNPLNIYIWLTHDILHSFRHIRKKGEYILYVENCFPHIKSKDVITQITAKLQDCINEVKPILPVDYVFQKIDINEPEIEKSLVVENFKKVFKEWCYILSTFILKDKETIERLKSEIMYNTSFVIADRLDCVKILLYEYEEIRTNLRKNPDE